MADAAAAAGVKVFVYSTLEDMEKRTKASQPCVCFFVTMRLVPWAVVSPSLRLDQPLCRDGHYWLPMMYEQFFHDLPSACAQLSPVRCII